MSIIDLAAASAVPFLLEDLPSEAVGLVAQHASTPSTPAACLLPRVCRGWREAADRAELMADISPNLAPLYLDCKELQLHVLRAGAGKSAAAAAAAAAAGLPGVPSTFLRGWRLAAWLAKYRSSVRSLCISRGAAYHWDLGPAWREHIRSIRDALTAKEGDAGSTCPPLPHLVQLELPISDLAGSSPLLATLSACPSLQRLVLKEAGRYHYKVVPSDKPSDNGFRHFAHLFSEREGYIDVEHLAAAAAPLSRLRVLHAGWAHLTVPGSSLAGLLRALPPTLEEISLTLRCGESIPLSCFTHLVNLRAWDGPHVRLVVDDTNSSSGGGSSSSSGSGSGSSSSCSAAAALTALTELRISDTTYKQDARLRLPSLCLLRTGLVEPAAWQQLQGMRKLQQLATSSCCVEHVAGGEPPLQGSEGAAGLGGMTQLRQLVLEPHGLHRGYQLSMVKPWASAVAQLTALTALKLHAPVMVAGGSTMLAPLTQLQVLTVACLNQLPPEYYAEGAEGGEATPAGAVLAAVAAALEGGRMQLQRLVLMVPRPGVVIAGGRNRQDSAEKVQAAAVASLPGLVVEVHGPPRDYSLPLLQL